MSIMGLEFLGSLMCIPDKISINCMYFYDGPDYKDTANRVEPANNGKNTLYCH